MENDEFNYLTIVLTQGLYVFNRGEQAGNY